MAKRARRQDRKGNSRQPTMTQETHPIVDLTNEDLDAMLKRALRITLIIGVISSLAVLIGGGLAQRAPCC